MLFGTCGHDDDRGPGGDVDIVGTRHHTVRDELTAVVEVEHLGPYLLYTGGVNNPNIPDGSGFVTQQGNTVKINSATGPLNADGSFVTTDSVNTWRGVFATEGGRSVIRGGDAIEGACHGTFVGTKR
jgi:hypothetical protein